MKKNKKRVAAILLNPVAKHARQFNKARIFRDRTKYTRKAKHHKPEPLPINPRVLSVKAPA